VRTLSLSSHTAWVRYADSGTLPLGIPKAPDLLYREQWISWGDFLSHGRLADQELAKKYWPFDQARSYVRALKLKSQKEWHCFCASGDKPVEIPSNPHNSYKNKEWANWADWLGTTNYRSGWRSFEMAREFAHSLRLSTRDGWSRYCQSGQKPADIPNKPSLVYAKAGWRNWADWLGSERLGTRNREFWPFLKARAFVRSLHLRGYNDWCAHRKSRQRPQFIPSNPNSVYVNKGGKTGLTGSGLSDNLHSLAV
jgi:hypothetical protein